MDSKITPVYRKLKPYINNSDLADVKFLVGKEVTEFYGHKFLLSITSPMWRTMFYLSNWSETKSNGISEVKIPDIDPDVFIKILEFSYIRKIELEEGSVMKVLKASDKFLMEELKEYCFEFLINNLNVKNAISTYQEIIKMNNQRQMERTLKYIATRREVLMTPNCFINVSTKTLLNILNCDELLVKEIHLLNRLIERIKSKYTMGRRNSLNSQNENDRTKESMNTKIEERSDEFKENENKIKNVLKKSKSKNKSWYTNSKGENEKNKTIWFKTDQNLKEVLDTFPFQFTIVRCLKEEWIKSIDNSDLKLLAKVQWPRFLESEYQYILDTKLFNKTKIKKYLNFIKETNLPPKYLGISGNVNVKTNKHPSRKPRIKKSEIKVLLLAAHNNSYRRKDVMKSLKSTGITYVKEINLCERTPTYKEVKGFDAIFLFSLSNFESPTSVGDILAEYVDNLGGVVICTINALRSDNNERRGLKGRIVSEDYLPIKKGKEISQERRILGKVEAKAHYIMSGVKSFDAGKNSWHIKTKEVTNDSIVICRFDNGNIMICEKTVPDRGKVVVLNFFPVSDSVRNNDDYWLTNTDGYHILANSIEYAAQK
ncbi:btb/poz domain-containing [Anaeramoeba flamelloides]|uniref:Btb/poz domain-containing n=1 Tax=Anaeramoeba flamelloides TaxID=1746091 RepID=A0ABQ8Y6R4_9EUKA|nr:btb/poz domain-containing [Anaeramoeba flamelloides]